MADIFTNLYDDVVTTKWYRFLYTPWYLDFLTLKISCLIIAAISVLIFGLQSLTISIIAWFLINEKLYDSTKVYLLLSYLKKIIPKQDNKSIFEIVNVKERNEFLLDDFQLFMKLPYAGKMYYFRNLRLLLFIPMHSYKNLLIIDPSNYRTIRKVLTSQQLVAWINDEIRFMLEMRVSKKNLYLTAISGSKYEYKNLSEERKYDSI